MRGPGTSQDWKDYGRCGFLRLSPGQRPDHRPGGPEIPNIAEYGNTSAASIPLVLSELEEAGTVGPGSRVLVVGFGGGLTWGGALVEFA